MIRCIALATVSALVLAACSPDAPPAPEAAAPATEEAAEAPVETPEVPASAMPNTEMVLTANGLGPLTIGMPRADIIEMMGGPETPAPAPGTDLFACEIFHPAEAPEGVDVLLEEGALASIYLTEDSSVPTDKGVKVGDSPDAVKAAYGDRLIESPSKYMDPPAGELTVWQDGHTSQDWVDDASARGIRYSVDTDGKIYEIKAGGPAIQLVEACS